MKSLMGKKLGMTQIFTEEGLMIPVTVVEIEPNSIVQVKTTEKEGYNAIQVGYGMKKEKNVNKPTKGHFEKAGATPKRKLKEFRVEDVKGYEAGQELKADLFKAGDFVDITGISKGKGFQGVIKRHGHSRGPETHGSRHHRRPGSLGAATYPGRVFKGTKLPGHMGNVKVTVQNLEISKIDMGNNVLLIKGAVPGPKKGILVIKETLKQGK